MLDGSVGVLLFLIGFLLSPWRDAANRSSVINPAQNDSYTQIRVNM